MEYFLVSVFLIENVHILTHFHLSDYFRYSGGKMANLQGAQKCTDSNTKILINHVKQIDEGLTWLFVTVEFRFTWVTW